jgi:two-component system, OmpR family, sensor kinase
MRSIRANLVLWTVGALAVGAVVVLAATYALQRKQLGVLFDEELKQVAFAVHLREDWQDRRLRIARPGFFLSVRAYDPGGHIYFETALPSLPADLTQTFEEGFAHFQTAEGGWRVYTHVSEEGVVQVGQPVASRDALARDLSVRVLMPMLLLIPLLAALIAWLLGRGLAPLGETSRLVSDRDASRLDPLPTTDVPEELRPLVQQINALLARLDDSLGGQRRFLADAAHELRSPVAALSLQVQLAARAHSDSARHAALVELGRGTERARRLVQQLLDYARLEPGVPSSPLAPLDVAPIVREVVGANAARAEEIAVDLGADAPDPSLIRGCEPELRSLLENLVDNALRYAPPGGAVTVGARRLGAEIELTVTDSGPGIPAAQRARVFERFHRVPGDATPGTGLGLSIVQKIVERHHGSIVLADAHPGAARPGLAVRIRLPAVAIPQLGPEPHRANDERQDQQKEVRTVEPR